ncbi:hypothetical protein EDB19DRAFT_1835080 [Suillus lakei]|nr:hypothetical protein EDB19DRAFT_1835080 [Suillus lakei]
MPPVCPTRGAQLTSMGLGHHFVSLKKSRDPKKTQTLVHIPGVNSQHQHLLDEMAALMKPQHSTTGIPSSKVTQEETQALMDIDYNAGHDDNDLSYIYDDDDHFANAAPQPDEGAPCPTDVPKVDLGRHCILPDKMAINLYNAWKVLIPTLVDPHLKYSARTHGHALPEVHPFVSFLTVLIHHGLFPTAPSQPCMAISTDLLAFYCAFFEHSYDAIHVLASALKTHYAHRGFQMTNTHGQLIQEPFRHGLGQAIQWFDILQIEVERQTEVSLQLCCEQVHEARELQSQENSGVTTPAGVPLFSPSIVWPALEASSSADLLVKVVTSMLQQMATSIIDIDDLRHKRALKIRTSLVPDEAIDQYGKKQKAAMESFDDTGVMALICRHDIPLFFANIDSPGEQQKYAVALIEHLFSLLLQEATVITLYDVDCVLSRSLSQYDILPSSVTSRLRFATTAMHAYGHEWACQLEFNPLS